MLLGEKTKKIAIFSVTRSLLAFVVNCQLMLLCLLLSHGFQVHLRIWYSIRPVMFPSRSTINICTPTSPVHSTELWNFSYLVMYSIQYSTFKKEMHPTPSQSGSMFYCIGPFPIEPLKIGL